MRLILTTLLIATVWFISTTTAQNPSRSPILTQHNDNNRTGAYLTERTLTPASVASRGMRLAYWRPVDGSIDGQLLYVPSLQIPPRLVDVIFATTTNGSVFAYDANDDADSGTGRGRLWQTSLLGRDEPQTPGTPYGVLSTPVIDLVAKMLFVVSRTKGDPIDEFWLLALDIVSGKILRKTQIESPGFSAAFQNQRPALLLDHDMVYIGFGQWGGEGDHEYPQCNGGAAGLSPPISASCGFGHQTARRDWPQQRSNAVGQYLGIIDAATPVAGEPHRPAASMA